MTTAHTRIRDLELVLALHEEGNVTRAAQRVGISEPAFSKQIQKIERRIQMQLFERSNGGVATTIWGQVFVPHAYDSVHAFYRAVNEAHESSVGKVHKLRIGASCFLGKRWVELLQSVEMRSYRGLNIEVIAAYTFDLVSRLQRHEIDLALVTSPPWNTAITTVSVASNPFIIVMREHHTLAAKQSVNLHEVAQFPWVFFERNVHPSLHDRILQKMQVEKLNARIWHLVSQADQVPALLRDDSLLAWLTPAGAKRIVGDGLIEIPLNDSEIRLETHLTALAANKSPVVSEYFRAFVKRVEEDRGPVQLTLPIGLASAV
jgi:DNA-binding transcriptional LysR family regulator